MVKRGIVASLLIVALAGGVNAATWTIDKVHSSVNFSVRHLVVSKVRGNFTDFDGTVKFDEGKLKDGSVELTVQTASIDTDNADRDDHLRSADFLYVEEHPVMSFKSKKVTDLNGDKFKLIGDLTIRGITKEVVFDCEYYGAVDDPWGNTKAGFSAETTINRQDFDVKWNKTLDAGGFVVGDDVDIAIELELAKS